MKRMLLVLTSSFLFLVLVACAQEKKQSPNLIMIERRK